jgi:dGTPase
MNPRQEREQLEQTMLSPFACPAARTRGRERPIRPCALRTAFQRDRDRIIHCKAFRRLTYKTQVFIAPEEDHYRTRLTHTLEVSQIARTIARALRLNEDLTEAIALGHDLGHTPFGHTGESALHEAYRQFDPHARFRHNEQSLRVVDLLERNGGGLNLTWEVRDGILGHSKGAEDIDPDRRGGPHTLEGRVAMIADRIAYLNHDLDDAMRAGLPARRLPEACRRVLGRTTRERINRMVSDVVEQSRGQARIAVSAEVRKAMDLFKDFLFDHVYRTGSTAKTEVAKVGEVLSNLFRLYMEAPTHLPRAYRTPPIAPDIEDPRLRARAVCDYIAGMSDRFARDQFILYFLPKGWRTASP